MRAVPFSLNVLPRVFLLPPPTHLSSVWGVKGEGAFFKFTGHRRWFAVAWKFWKMCFFFFFYKKHFSLPPAQKCSRLLFLNIHKKCAAIIVKLLITMQDEKRDSLRLFERKMLTSWSTGRIYHLIAICHHWHQQADHKTPPGCCSSSIPVLSDVLRCSGLIKNTCALTNVTSRLWKGSTVWEHLRCLFSTVMLPIFTRRCV